MCKVGSLTVNNCILSSFALIVISECQTTVSLSYIKIIILIISNNLNGVIDIYLFYFRY